MPLHPLLLTSKFCHRAGLEVCALFRAVTTEDIGIARGAVAVLAAHSLGDQHRLLIVHGDSGAVIWDLRFITYLVMLQAELSTLPVSGCNLLTGCH